MIFRTFSIAFCSFLFCSCASVVETTPKQFLIGPLDVGVTSEKFEAALSRAAYLRGLDTTSRGLSGKGSSGAYMTGSLVAVTALTKSLLQSRNGPLNSSPNAWATLEDDLCFDFKFVHTTHWVRDGELDPLLDWSQWKLLLRYEGAESPLVFSQAPLCDTKEQKRDSIRKSFDNTCKAKICLTQAVDMLKPIIIQIEFTKSKQLLPLVFGWNGIRK